MNIAKGRRRELKEILIKDKKKKGDTWQKQGIGREKIIYADGRAQIKR